jgi:lichenan operon transcriptional antiterminator
MILSQRLQKILELLNESRDTVTGEFLCSSLGVSSRTIRSDIKELNDILENNGASIISEKARGYKLEVMDKSLFNILINSIRKNITLDNNTSLGRAENIIVKLLINKLDEIDGITQVELADSLFVSISSLKNDMKIVKDILEVYQLNIEKVSNKGIGIIGTEENLRTCIKKYIYFNEEIKQKVKYELEKVILNQREEYIISIVKNNISEFNFKLSDKALKDIISSVIIMIIRNSKRKNVEYDKETQKKLKNVFRYRVAKAICDDIGNKLDIDFNEDEVLYLTKYILAGSSIVVENNKDIELSNEYDLVNKILLKIKERFNMNFLKDNILINFLVHHLKASICRAQYGILVENSLLIAIKNNYPFALELAVYSNEVIKEVVGANLSEDDIGFIALHFAAAVERFEGNVKKNRKDVIIVCETGIGTSLLLKVRLESKFKERINILDTIPNYEFNEDVLNNSDLVISTIPLGVDSNKIVYVKSLLDSDEINLIDDKLNGNSLNGNLLVDKFKEELFFNNLEGNTRDEVLVIITRELIDRGYISEGVREDVFRRENLASTEIGDLVAIPHNMSEEINESFISVALLNKAITWNKEKVQVVFFIGMCIGDKEEWKTYLKEIYKNIIDIEIIKKIIKCQSFDDLKKVILKF